MRSPNLPWFTPPARRQTIKARIQTLLQDPHPAGARKLANADWNGRAVYRIRSGQYRILYSVTRERQILIIRIGHRGSVYRRFA